MGVQASKGTNSHTIKWHRTPLSKETSRTVHAVSDVKGLVQAGGWLAMLALWFGLALHYQRKGSPWLSFFFVLLYGCQANFAINGMHELGHGFVFKSQWLQVAFLRTISFLGWLHPDMFFSSHFRHHRYTQNFPHDQEAPQPTIPTLSAYLHFAFVNVFGCCDILTQTVKAALGIYPTKHLWWTPMWEEVCYPPADPALRRRPMAWAQFMLLGHAAIAAWSLHNGLWLIPVMISFGPFYMGWAFLACNSVQHIGMHHGNAADGTEVPDFRLSTRTFHIVDPESSCFNPLTWPKRLVQFWYWHMNYHIEHHMYAAVPCYHLQELHSAIKHDLPPTPNGFIEVWSVIIDILRKQLRDPGYCMPVKLPQGLAPPSSKQLSPALWEKQRVKKEDAGAAKSD